MRKILLILLALVLAFTAVAQKKREFRGAWIQCVNGQFQGLGTVKMQETLRYQLNELKKDGVNAIIFQVRPECDALYNSKIEPWSRFLTGQQGKAPSPYWDPLQWMIDECHARDMELHAWINPYRAKTKVTQLLSTQHVAIRKPQNCFNYDGQIILNPGLQENSDYICAVVQDIVSRYDVDGLHIDDYFYPYPAAGQEIPDQTLYRVNGKQFSNIQDWRRNNVNLFVKQLYETVHQTKPWVKVGISPFGIYRNQKNYPHGSKTNGLQNYDDLYADVLLWIDKGWLDYCVPQLYWEIGHQRADYATLIRWWDQYAGGRPLFIGEDIERTVKNADLANPHQHQQAAKHSLYMHAKNAQGIVLWYAKAAVDNPGNYATMLRKNYWQHPSLMPQMPFISTKTPKKPRKLKDIWVGNDHVLCWTAPRGKKWTNKAAKYAVYRFRKGEKINIENPAKIVAVTHNTFYKLPNINGQQEYVYAVTSLNRLQNESKVVKRKVKL